MIQIDGLSRNQFERAIARGRMPFLQSLLSREGYDLHTFYSGIPSTTPAVQAELFYGVKAAVPAFGFRDQETGQIVEMLNGDTALRRQHLIAKEGAGLLKDGSAYSDIYSGEAAEAHFCPAVMGWGNLLDNAGLPRSLLVLFWNAMFILRTVFLLGVESFVAMVDALRGLVAGRSFWEELKFVPTRIAVCVLLREFVAIGAEIDATRGLPVIHLNLIGYDEQAHRRGPGSRFAHWSLRQIDKSISRVCDAAFRSSRRDYQVWIYSDHGQEETVPYSTLRGKPLEDVVSDYYLGKVIDPPADSRQDFGVVTHRAAWLGGGLFQRLLPKIGMEKWLPNEEIPLVAGKGPVGHIYWPREISFEQKCRLAEHLVQQEKVPLAFTLADDGTVFGWNRKGRLQLPQDAGEAFGSDHPFLKELTQDWISLCRHEEAGTLVVSGWRPHGKSVTFPMENGAHAGPGSEETRAFALLPRDVALPLPGRGYIRPLELRHAAQRLLRTGSTEPNSEQQEGEPASRSTERLRVLTYNVHSCIGLDGKLSPRRIARVIAQCRPDIVALQELDVGRTRTGGEDQAHAIAHELEMEFQFHPTIHIEEEKYGNAILSRFPMRLRKAGSLPAGRVHSEPRGAIWVSIQVGKQEWQVLNTHLSLSGRERMAQVHLLMGAEWLSHPDCCDPVILCGDFNAGPNSPAYRLISQQLKDAQLSLSGAPKSTWSSVYPVRRIDHVFSRGPVNVSEVEVPKGRLARVSSDHLPVVTELQLELANVSNSASVKQDEPPGDIVRVR